MTGHEPIAALTCAVTALAAAAGRCVAVGASADGFVVLPPRSTWGWSYDHEELWAERELRAILHGPCGKTIDLRQAKIYEGMEIIDLRQRRARAETAP